MAAAISNRIWESLLVRSGRQFTVEKDLGDPWQEKEGSLECKLQPVGSTGGESPRHKVSGTMCLLHVNACAVPVCIPRLLLFSAATSEAPPDTAHVGCEEVSFSWRTHGTALWARVPVEGSLAVGGGCLYEVAHPSVVSRPLSSQSERPSLDVLPYYW